MRLIDADELLKNMDTEPEYVWDNDAYTCGINMERERWVREISNAQTADAVFTVYGRWIKNEDRQGWNCSACNTDDLFAFKYDCLDYELQDFYCPHCGAKMNGVVDRSERKD